MKSDGLESRFILRIPFFDYAYSFRALKTINQCRYWQAKKNEKERKSKMPQKDGWKQSNQRQTIEQRVKRASSNQNRMNALNNTNKREQPI